MTPFESIIPGFRLRKPAWMPRGCSLGTGRGDCLEPLVPADADMQVLTDERMTPQHGDLVLVRMHESVHTWFLDLIERADDEEMRAAWKRMYMPDGNFPLLALKVYLEFDGVPHVTCRDFTVALADYGKVIAVCRHVQLDGVPVFGSRRIVTWLLSFRDWLER